MSSRPRPGALERDLTQYPWRKTIIPVEKTPRLSHYIRPIWTEPAGPKMAQKAVSLGLITGYAGGVGGFLNAFIYQRTTSVGLSMYYFISSAAPAAAVGAGYVVGTGVAAKMRQKDDPINHAFGGLLAGSIRGARVKCPWMGLTWGVGFGLLGMLMKYLTMNGWDARVFNRNYEVTQGVRFNHFKPLYQSKPSEEGFLPPDVE